MHRVTLVLVVDDEPQIRRTLEVNLRVRGYQVDLADSGEAALASARATRPDLVVLDLGLPGIDGITVLRELRSFTAAPVLVLTVRDAEAQKVIALDAGADDYITKPFGMDELLARVRAAVRRATPAATEPPLVVTPDFTIDLAAKEAANARGAVRLTPTEWHVVELLTTSPGRLVTHEQLLTHVWGPGYRGADTNLLRVHVGHIRRKLEPAPSRPRYFITEPGMGYRFTR